jgi:Lrp/AsnC family leucine-responsive transcriptional regulator
MTDIDRYDRRLLRALMRNGRATLAALAEEVALSPTQCARRMQRLEQQGLIAGYQAILDRHIAGFGVMALVNVSLERQGEGLAQAFQQAVADLPEVVECLLLTGDADYQLRVIERDLDSYAEFVTNRLMRLPGIAHIRSSIALREVKQECGLPL